jgi:hypothetical protein
MPRATSRASSRHRRAPVGLDVRAHAAQGHRHSRHAPPHAPHPEAPRSPLGASRAAPRRTGPGLAADRRSVGGTPPYARRPRAPCYRENLAPSPHRHRSEHAYKNRAIPFPCAATALLHPAIADRRQAHLPALSPVHPTLLACSLVSIEACAATHCATLPFPRRNRSPPRVSPPAAAARPRRSLPRSNPGLPRALGEHVVMPYCLPGRECGRLARIRPALPPPMVEGPNCAVLILCRAPAQMFIFYSASFFAGTCKMCRQP